MKPLFMIFSIHFFQGKYACKTPSFGSFKEIDEVTLKNHANLKKVYKPSSHKTKYEYEKKLT